MKSQLKRARQAFLLLAACSLIVGPTPAVADRTGKCSVLVRVVRGANRDLPARSLPQSLINDVGTQLDSLPFNSYSLVDAKEQTVRFGQEAAFVMTTSVGVSHAVRVVPHDVSRNRVGLTVDWKGPRGEDLLSTKLRVANGKCVVLGSEGRRAATIMTVRPDCG